MVNNYFYRQLRKVYARKHNGVVSKLVRKNGLCIDWVERSSMHIVKKKPSFRIESNCKLTFRPAGQ